MLRMKIILPFFVMIQIMLGAGTVIGLSYVIEEIDTLTALFFATGGPSLTLLGIGLALLPQLIAADKEQGILEYMWSLPLPRVIYLLADLLIWTIATLPGLILALLIATWYYGFELQINLLIIPGFLLVASTATLIGYSIAYLSPKAQITSVITNLIIYSLFLFSPINYPIERLPLFLQSVHKVLPVYYMSDIVRGNLTQITLNNGMWLSFLVVSIWFVISFMITLITINKRT